MPLPAQPSAHAAPDPPTRWMAGLQAAIVCGIPTQLMLAAVLTPDQSPILPLEISMVLAALAGWVAWRRSRIAFGALGGFAILLVALTLHILVGDIDASTGARELVPDVLILGAGIALVANAVRALRRTPVAAIA